MRSIGFRDHLPDSRPEVNPCLTGTVAAGGPIVGVSIGDAVAEGWAASLARPGGHITGTASIPEEYMGLQ